MGQDEDSLGEGLSPADRFLAAAMAAVFVDYLRDKTGKRDPAIIVGIDSRPTGPAIADAMCRIFLGLGAKPRYLFMVAAPEIMAYAKHCGGLPEEHEEHADAFCYVSASHNPPGHNGVKFGLSAQGGVLPGPEAAILIERFKATIESPDLVRRMLYAAEEADPRDLARLYSGVTAMKRRSVSAYTLFAREVVTGLSEPYAQEAFLEAMSSGALSAPVGVVAELNGSARALSIDEDFLAGIGVRYRPLNAQPREFAHRIVPEGESLEPCCRALEAAHAEDRAFTLGYVPDCDGDRGNLVIFDEAQGKARALAAQEVFALCCVAESAQLVHEGLLRPDGSGMAREKVAIAVNDATSMRIEAIAKCFGIEVRRAETGEANVVGLAERLRADGYIVRILGEGSNGGNITYPSAVRDPLATLGAALKLLLLRDAPAGKTAGNEGLFHIWMGLSGRGDSMKHDFGLSDILASLPAFSTTSAFEPEAMLTIRATDHAKLKAAYHGRFAKAWEADGAEFRRRFGAVSWKALATKGSEETRADDDFASSGRGGLRILFLDKGGSATASVWMRGSGTEPVFRVMADVEGGSRSDEAWLLDWHRRLVIAADDEASK
jgi:phosphoglucomutase